MIPDVPGGGCDVSLGRGGAAVINAATALIDVPVEDDCGAEVAALEQAVKKWRRRRRTLGERGAILVKLSDLKGG